MIAVGVDLAGPKRADRTALVAWRNGRVVEASMGWDDVRIVEYVDSLPRDVAVAIGLDAPLSYPPEGGDRAADRALRKQLVAAGLHPGTLLAPLAPRMVYLTLRGISLTRDLEKLARTEARIVEVHPAGVLALNGAPVDAVRDLKTRPSARRQLIRWLSGQGLAVLTDAVPDRDHIIAAAAAALAAARWASGDAIWVWKADPPSTLYDFAC